MLVTWDFIKTPQNNLTSASNLFVEVPSVRHTQYDTCWSQGAEIVFYQLLHKDKIQLQPEEQQQSALCLSAAFCDESKH